MLRLRPFRKNDAKSIITWTSEPEEFMKWSAGILGQFPLTEERMIEATSGRDDNEQYFPFTAFDVYGAQSVGLGVFDNNKAAYNCYKSVGFKETGECVTYEIGGNTWTDVEMEISR